jgi:hypothetical protein
MERSRQRESDDFVEDWTTDGNMWHHDPLFDGGLKDTQKQPVAKTASQDPPFLRSLPCAPTGGSSCWRFDH